MSCRDAYGSLKGTPYKWLDLSALYSVLLRRTRSTGSGTAQRTSARGRTTRSSRCGSRPTSALQTLPGLSVHPGHYLVSYPRVPLRHPPVPGPRTVEVIKSEEKGSDVNLATYLLLDAFRRDCDTAVVITNESDLREPIEIAQAELGMGWVWSIRRRPPTAVAAC